MDLLARHRRLAIVVLTLSIALPPAAAGTDSDADCGLEVLSLVEVNCGTLTLSVDIVDTTCTNLPGGTLTRCRVDASATGTGVGWVNPGSVETAISGVCSSSARKSWTLFGDSAPTSCSRQVDFPRGQTSQVSASATARFGGTATPRDLSASAGDSITPPPPSGPRVTLYRNPNQQECERSFDNDVLNLNAFQYVNCPGVGMNDSVSSARVREDCSVILYEHSNFGGRALPLGPGDHDSLPGFDNITSSFDLTCAF